jgi:acyl-CoA thioesterase-1
LGADYEQAFNRIFPDLAAADHLLLYPFFLAGVLSDQQFTPKDQQLVQRDGLHPTAAGVDVIVAGMLPKAEELLARVRGRRGG